jgi:glycosyltransferase involved in cell wall biosynthesis
MSDIAESNARILVVAHDLSVTGGVNNFLRVMRRRLRGKVRIDRFVNGRRKGEKRKTDMVKRLILDYLRFASMIVSGRFNYDVLHINPTLDRSSMPRELLFVIILKVLRRRSRVLIFFRGWEWSTYDWIAKSAVRRFVFKKIQGCADRVLVLSQDFKDALIELGVDKDVIAVSTTMFEGEVLQKALSANIEKRPGQLIFLSRFLPAKGGVSILEAVARLRPIYPHLRLVMAGDGPQRRDLEDLSEALGILDVVTFTGYVSGFDKMRHLVESEIFVLPTSHPEGMPNAILEALAAGCVIITTAVGGISSIITDPANGTILKATTNEAVTKAIEQYLDDEECTAKIGRVNQEKAWNTWESQIISDKLGEHYHAVIQNK